MKLNHRFNFPLRRTKQGAGWAAWREETVEDRDNTSVSKGRYRPRRGLSGLKPSLAQIWTGLSLSQRCTWSFAFGYLLGLRKAFPSFTVLIIYDGLKVASWEHTGFKKKQKKKTISKPRSITAASGAEDGERWAVAALAGHQGRVPLWVWQYNEEQARYQGQAVSQDYSTNCFHLPSHPTPCHPVLWNYAGKKKKLLADELKAPRRTVCVWRRRWNRRRKEMKTFSRWKQIENKAALCIDPSRD